MLFGKKKRDELPKKSKKTANAKVMQDIQTALLEAKLPGFSYLEFKNSVKALDATPMSEEQKYNAVFNIAGTMGLDIDELLASQEHYVSVLNDIKNKFDAKIAERKEQEITSRENQIKLHKDTINGAEAEFKALQLKIENATKSLDELTDEVNEETVAITRDVSSFNITHDMVKEGMATDRVNITKYLRPVTTK